MPNGNQSPVVAPVDAAHRLVAALDKMPEYAERLVLANDLSAAGIAAAVLPKTPADNFYPLVTRCNNPQTSISRNSSDALRRSGLKYPAAENYPVKKA